MIRQAALLILIAGLGLVGCSSGNDALTPGSGNNNNGVAAAFAAEMEGEGCAAGTPSEIVFSVENLTAYNAAGEAVMVDAADIPLMVDCSGGKVSLTSSEAVLPVGDYVALEVTITGLSVDGQDVPLPGGAATIGVRLDFSVTDGTQNGVVFSIDIANAFALVNGDFVFTGVGVSASTM